jgi:hypothetical protein
MTGTGVDEQQQPAAAAAMTGVGKQQQPAAKARMEEARAESGFKRWTASKFGIWLLLVLLMRIC